MAGKRKKIDEKELLHMKHVRRAGELFSELRKVGCERDMGNSRKLFFNDYCSWILFYAMNPAIDSARMLQASSKLKSVQNLLRINRFSTGAFSEAPEAFEPDKLKPIIARLAARVTAKGVDKKLEELQYAVQLTDSTLLRTLPGLVCTRYNQRKDGEDYHAWRVHMEFEVGMPAATRATVTGVRKGGDERKTLKRRVRQGCCYVMDRGYHDVSLFNRIHEHDSRYVCRVRDFANYNVVKELPLSPQQVAEGIISDQIVLVGQRRTEPPTHRVRLVIVKAEVHPKRTKKGVKPSSGRILLLSNLTAKEAPAELVGLLYRYRWTIELFFRFLKQVQGMNHLLGHSKKAVQIFVYCMVICCLLLYLWTGVVPNKQITLMIHWYQTGLASLDELMSAVEHERQKTSRSKTTV